MTDLNTVPETKKVDPSSVTTGAPADAPPAAPTAIQAATANALDKETNTWRANIPFVLMTMVTMGLFALIGVLCYHEVPEKSASIIYNVVGTITSGWMIGVGYFWGTSASSKAKDNAIVALSSK
jgi:hypothetical protein